MKMTVEGLEEIPASAKWVRFAEVARSQAQVQQKTGEVTKITTKRKTNKVWFPPFTAKIGMVPRPPSLAPFCPASVLGLSQHCVSTSLWSSSILGVVLLQHLSVPHATTPAQSSTYLNAPVPPAVRSAYQFPNALSIMVPLMVRPPQSLAVPV